MPSIRSPKISVIIPIYNAERYISECLKSIVSQSFEDFEVILINDGSTDKSLDICNYFAKGDKRIKIISTPNNGVSYARNLGIKRAQGEWITFIDSDDTIYKDFFEKAMNYKHDETEIIFCGFNCNENNKIIETNYLNNITYKKEQFNEAFATTDIIYWGYPWGKFYRNSILKEKNILFNESLSISEDRLFFYTYIIYVSTITLIDNIGYNYRINYNGLSRKKHDVNLYLRRMVLLKKSSYIIKKTFHLNTDGFSKFWYFNIYYLSCYIDALLHNVYNPLKRIKIYRNALKNFFDYDFYNCIINNNKEFLRSKYFIKNKKYMYLARHNIFRIELTNIICLLKHFLLK